MSNSPAPQGADEERDGGTAGAEGTQMPPPRKTACGRERDVHRVRDETGAGGTRVEPPVPSGVPLSGSLQVAENASAGRAAAPAWHVAPAASCPG